LAGDARTCVVGCMVPQGSSSLDTLQHLAHMQSIRIRPMARATNPEAIMNRLAAENQALKAENSALQNRVDTVLTQYLSKVTPAYDRCGSLPARRLLSRTPPSTARRAKERSGMVWTPTSGGLEPHPPSSPSTPQQAHHTYRGTDAGPPKQRHLQQQTRQLEGFEDGDRNGSSEGGMDDTQGWREAVDEATGRSYWYDDYGNTAWHPPSGPRPGHSSARVTQRFVPWHTKIPQVKPLGRLSTQRPGLGGWGQLPRPPHTARPSAQRFSAPPKTSPAAHRFSSNGALGYPKPPIPVRRHINIPDPHPRSAQASIPRPRELRGAYQDEASWVLPSIGSQQQRILQAEGQVKALARSMYHHNPGTPQFDEALSMYQEAKANLVSWQHMFKEGDRAASRGSSYRQDHAMPQYYAQVGA